MIDRFFEQFSVLLKEDYYNSSEMNVQQKNIEKKEERKKKEFDWHIGSNNDAQAESVSVSLQLYYIGFIIIMTCCLHVCEFEIFIIFIHLLLGVVFIKKDFLCAWVYKKILKVQNK